MPSMLRTNSYDTICHEHLEYYSLGVICRILKAADLKPVDVAMNAVNGDSFAVTAARRSNRSIHSNREVIDWLLEQDDRMGLGTPLPFRNFEERAYRTAMISSAFSTISMRMARRFSGMVRRPRVTLYCSFAGSARKTFRRWRKSILKNSVPIPMLVNPDYFRG